VTWLFSLENGITLTPAAGILRGINLMVYGPGGYKFTDFFKIGIPLTIVVGVVSVLLNFPLPAYDFPN
jgi:di/tricarboxylate transporter